MRVRQDEIRRLASDTQRLLHGEAGAQLFDLGFIERGPAGRRGARELGTKLGELVFQSHGGHLSDIQRARRIGAVPCVLVRSFYNTARAREWQDGGRTHRSRTMEWRDPGNSMKGPCSMRRSSGSGGA